MFRTPLALFRTLAIAEAVSWTLLIAGLIIRATADAPIAVTIGGAIHGFVFLSYGATAIIVAKNQRWSAGAAILAIGSAVIPYATIPTELWLHRTSRLSGEWRRTETADPRDARWHDRLLRMLLNHPWAFGIAMFVLVVLAYVVLLNAGPPGGRS
ncbi:DUF3817 domain-containing protein [Microbacterium sp. cx-55]|uniref:DUF3817 domain-containing protein n=1 Tax=unclassified Microbacterium TaxID=2609290 RepID=UPI001CC10893|nr:MULTISPECIES: DUF3817 domain-containing protein [unclassified Microbacterium]MBZ4485741.1 DUF3817 domain-containing protein [Microbacterium sp. cx-55]MCC4906704.1 DUF3817 domain-containing protein [Microbacterium sp. cx-59]UGB34372.1 DUF3817 domain-containing protein [Microbacterium sp. cx-55]